MAQKRLLLSLSVLLLLLAIGADARPGVHFHPCKTFIISSYSFSTFKPSFNLPQNPNAETTIPDLTRKNLIPFEYVTVVTDFHPRPRQPHLTDDIFVNRHAHRFQRFPRIPRDDFQIGFRHSEPAKPVVPFVPFGVSNSLRERTKDILSVVVALLFGVGCGALTSATMYLVWSLVTNRYEAAHDDDDDFYDDDASPKKMGYTMITTTDAAPAAPASAKEVV